jgi:hypothetical protein
MPIQDCARRSRRDSSAELDLGIAPELLAAVAERTFELIVVSEVRAGIVNSVQAKVGCSSLIARSCSRERAATPS